MTSRWNRCRFSGRYSRPAIDQVGHVAADLNDFFQAGQSLADLAEAVAAECDHAVLAGDLAQVAYTAARHHHVAELVVEEQQLVDAQPSAVARVAAAAAADAFVELVDRKSHPLDRLPQRPRRL